MDILNNIYSECHSLGSAFGFGAFEGGVIYASIFSIIIFKGVDAIKEVIDKNKKTLKVVEEPISINVKVIK